MVYPNDYTNFSFITDCPSAMDYDEEINNLKYITNENNERILYLEISNKYSNRKWRVFI